MKLNYKVEPEQYKALLVEILRIKERQPFQILLFLALSVFQLIAVLTLYFLNQIPTEYKGPLIGLSLAMSGINVLYRVLRPQRASITLKRMVRDNTLHPDFWKEHRFSVSEGMLRVSYGSLRLECPCADVTECREIEGAVCIFSRGKVFEIIPANVIEKTGGIRALLQTLAGNEDSEKVFQGGMHNALPENPLYEFRFRISEKAYLKMQTAGWRLDCICQLYSRAGEIAAVFLSALLIYTMPHQTSLLISLLCLGLLVYANRKLLRILSPSVPFMLSEKLPGIRFSEQEDHVIALDQDKIYYSDTCTVYSIYRSDISRVITMPLHTYVLGKDLPYYIIPYRAMGSLRERIAFAKDIKHRRSV